MNEFESEINFLKRYLFIIPFISPFLFLGLLEFVLYATDVELFVEKKENIALLNIQQCRYGQQSVDDLCKFEIHEKNESKKDILILGDSTAAGYPDYKENNFSSLLSTSLNAQSPPHPFYSVQNYARNCRDSDFVRRCFLRAIEAKPDMVIIYVGHNDFTNWFHPYAFSSTARKFPWIFDAVSFLRVHSRIYSLITALLKSNKPSYMINSEAQYQERLTEVTNDYVKNMAEISSTADKNHIKLAIIVPVSNLSEFAPPPRELENPFFHEKRAQALNLIQEGRKLMVTGDSYASLQKYIQARDNDPIPSRVTSSAQNKLIKTFSSKENILLINFQEELQKDFPTKHTFGCDLFGGHVTAPCDQFHLNTRGHWLLSELLKKEIKSKWPEF